IRVRKRASPMRLRRNAGVDPQQPCQTERSRNGLKRLEARTLLRLTAAFRTAGLWRPEERIGSAPGSRNAGMIPGCAVRPAQNLGGFGVPYNHAPLRVVNYRPADLHSDVGEDATRGGDVAFLDIGNRAAAFLDGGE